MGYSRGSHEYVVWDSDAKEIKMARTLQRVPELERFDVKHAESINIRPKDLLHRSSWKASTQAERPQRLGHEAEGEDAPTTRAKQFRGLKVTAKDLLEHQYTMHGCPKCDHMIVWGTGQGCTQAHSEGCRRRIAEELAKTPEGRARLKAVEDRRIRFEDEKKTAAFEKAVSSRPASRILLHEPTK